LSIYETVDGEDVDTTKRHRSLMRVTLSTAITWLESLRLPKFLNKDEEGLTLMKLGSQ
jgi:hypothetical protein